MTEKSANIAISSRVTVVGNKGQGGTGTIIRIDGQNNKIKNVVIRMDTGEKVEVKAEDVIQE